MAHCLPNRHNRPSGSNPTNSAVLPGLLVRGDGGRRTDLRDPVRRLPKMGSATGGLRVRMNPKRLRCVKLLAVESEGEMPHPGGEGPTNAESELFTETVGVSEDQLRSRGVDPSQYARDHIGEALRDPQKAERLLPDSTRSMVDSLRWGGRYYTALFAALAALLVVAFVHLEVVRIVGLVLASAAVVVAFVMFCRQIRSYRRYRTATQVEGIPTRTLFNRPMPKWRRRD